MRAVKKLKKLLLVLSLGFFLSSVWRINQGASLSDHFEIAPNVQAQSAESCSIIGNNTAVPTSGDEEGALYTLVLLTRGGPNTGEVIGTINSHRNVIVRLGQGEAPVQTLEEANAEADSYISALRTISAAVPGKSFLVTASHNEPNCAESVPFDVEMAFARKMASTSIPGVTWISGQVDYLCGDFEARGDKSPGEYIAGFANIAGIQGIALPFYTGDAGTSTEMIDRLRGAISSARGKSIYITESGPFKRGSALPTREEFLDYVTGVQQAIALPNVRGLMLFNAFGLSDQSDAAFSYTKYFWSSACREAFRTQCSDAEAVTDICFEGSPDNDDYYVEPINGLLDYVANGFSDPDNKIMDTIYEDLVAQGYQAYCSMPSTDIRATSNATSYMVDRMLEAEQASQNRIVTTIPDYEQFFNYIDSQAPIWRRKGVYVLSDKDSLEQFWSHKNTETMVESVPVDVSTDHLLLDIKSQCVQKKKILKAVDLKCNRLEDPTSCALDITFNPGNLKFWELHKSIEETDFDCSLMTKKERDLSPDQIEIRDSLLNMPFAMPTAYRFAFVVYSAELREPRIGAEAGLPWEQTTRKPGFDFLRNPFPPQPGLEPNSDPRNEVRILAFLVPDFAMNQDNFDFTYTPPPEINFPDSNNKNTTFRQHTALYNPIKELNFKDSLKIIRDNQLTTKQQEKNIEEWRQKKQLVTFPDIVGNFNPESSKDKLIECMYLSNGQPAPPEYRCNTPLEMALTTFVNRRVENPLACKSPNDEVYDFEKNEDIFSGAGIALSDEGLNQFYEGTAYNLLLDGLYPNGAANVIDSSLDTSPENTDDPSRNVYAFHFLSHYAYTSFGRSEDPIYGGEQPPDDENTVASIYAYLVYPQGYELEAIEEALLGTFLTASESARFYDQIEKDKIPKYFKMTGVGQTFNQVITEHGQTFADRPEAECLSDYANSIENATPDEDGEILTYGEYREQNCFKKPSVTLSSDPNPVTDREPRLLGAIFGRVTITIQQALRIAGSISWNYVTSCLESESPTEDFLLGRCSGKVSGESPEDTQPSPDEACIEVFVTKEKADQYAAQLRANLPEQGIIPEPGRTETLWERYYRGYFPGENQVLFENCDRRTPCYDEVIDRALAINLNPYLAIAIALNETGGFKSNLPGDIGPHFGCGVDPDPEATQTIKNDTVENKLDCMINFFETNSSLSANEAMTKYGYRNGYNNHNISTIISLLSYQKYQGSCTN